VSGSELTGSELLQSLSCVQRQITFQGLVLDERISTNQETPIQGTNGDCTDIGAAVCRRVQLFEATSNTNHCQALQS
jgi:hypothetical protein